MWFTPEGAKMAHLSAFKATWRSIKSQDPKSEQVPSGGQDQVRTFHEARSRNRSEQLS